MRYLLALLTGLLIAAALMGAGEPVRSITPAPPPSSWQSQGEVIWVTTPDGRVKLRAYVSHSLTPHPVLVVWLHGDLGPGSEPYEVAQQLATLSDNVVAAAVLRPGYTDAEGDTSAGRKGLAIGDNYTARVADDVHASIERLKAHFHPRAIVLMGHSGGAGVSANILGRHPRDAAAAVLIACSCDPKGFMERWVREHPDVPRGLPNPSLSPIDLAPHVPRQTLVRMVTGSNDTVVGVAPSQAYASALARVGVDVRLVLVPGAGHADVLGSDAVHQAVAEVITAAGGVVHSPARSARP